MQMLFYKNDKLVKDPLVTKSNDLSFYITDDDVKMIISLKPEVTIIRENEEYYFKLDITNNTCIYKLKRYNLCYDIDILKNEYREDDNEVEIIYRLNTDEDINKIIIKKGC